MNQVTNSKTHTLLLKCFAAGMMALGIVGCSNSNDTPNNVPGEQASVFSDSDAVNERYGERTTRELEPQASDAALETVVSGINNLSFELHRAISTNDPSKGSIESGFSAAFAFALASGATGGDTYSELSNLLGFAALEEADAHAALNELDLALSSRANEKLVLRTANRVFVQPALNLNSDFLDTATAHFGAPVTEADFAGAPAEVVDEVNQWVSDQTDGFIPKIIDSFSADTVFALLNSIFLDAAWEHNYIDSGDRPFTLADGTVVQLPGFSGRSSLNVIKNEQLTALELPYGGGELAMLLMMPGNLNDFEASLTVESFNSIKAQLEMRDVRFLIPNWDDKVEYDLMQLLAPLGLPVNPWNFERLATGVGSLEVLAKQVARIEVDKDGTRAAAATIVAENASVPEPVVIDRPFMFVLHDKTSGVVLFTGRVVNPE